MDKSFQLMIVLAVVSGTIAGHLLLNQSPKLEVIFPGRSDFANACTQKSKGRTWKEVRLDTVVSISNYDGKPLLEPLRVKVGQNDYIYVLDIYAPGVLKFSQSGNFVQLYGKGKGEGPGEFELPHDFSVNSSGDVFVCDPRTGLVTVFDVKGNVKLTARTKGLPSYVVAFNDGSFVIVQDGIGPMFQKYDPRGNFNSEFGNFLEKQSTYAMPLDALIASSGEGFCGGFFWAGFIYSYDKTGNQKYLCETIDKYPLPKFDITQTRQENKITTHISPSKDAPLSALDVSVDDSLLYVLAAGASKKEGAVVMDAYKASSGKYLYSFKFRKLPGTEGIRSTVVRRGYLYTCEYLQNGGTIIRKYKLTF
ncbi:MAG: 6-bladed beta-propeller [Candidatus Kryptoniota bacterium]